MKPGFITLMPYNAGGGEERKIACGICLVVTLSSKTDIQDCHKMFNFPAI